MDKARAAWYNYMVFYVTGGIPFVDETQNARIEQLLETIQKPARYVGGEMNAAVKPWSEAALRFAFCFPDTYEIAMSHLGMKILTAIINDLPYALCERVCMPWPDFGDKLRENGIPLFSLESRHALSEFDVVGFTLQYEMSFTNILDMLSAGNVPLLSKDRGEGAPLVIAGGPCAVNPEPLAPFIDLFQIGDGEEMMVEFMDALRECKKKALSREETLIRLAQIEGVYVPRFYEPTYHEDGTLKSFTRTTERVPETVRRRILRDLNGAKYPTAIPVPYTEIVHDRIVLEIMRGCTRGCRFCQAGMIYRPVRERKMERVLELADALEKSTGYEEMSLSSLSSGDYTCLPELIAELMARYRAKRVSVSLPSMRIDNLVKTSLEETSQVKKSGLTLAPEAGTQRLRDVINKGVTEEDLIRAVTDAFSSGWSSVKLYFMTGLPTETDEDLRGIADLARKVVGCYFTLPKDQRARGLRVTVSASVFVPKPFTPFQWVGQDSLPLIKEKQSALREYLKLKGVVFNWHEPELSMLEACVARGDRRIADVILAAYKKGCRLDSWSEFFKFDLWMEAFAECGLDPAFYASRVRPYDELLPWGFIDCGVTQEYLMREAKKAEKGETTRDCRKGCNGCGLNRYEGMCAL